MNFAIYAKGNDDSVWSFSELFSTFESASDFARLAQESNPTIIFAIRPVSPIKPTDTPILRPDRNRQFYGRIGRIPSVKSREILVKTAT